MPAFGRKGAVMDSEFIKEIREQLISLEQKIESLKKENEGLKDWQTKIRQLIIQAQNIGYCEIKRGKHFKCSLDDIAKQILKEK